MEKKVVKITINKKGEFRTEAMEGFHGENCINQTKDLELILGGTEIASGVKPSFYDGDNPNEIDIFQ